MGEVEGNERRKIGAKHIPNLGKLIKRTSSRKKTRGNAEKGQQIEEAAIWMRGTRADRGQKPVIFLRSVGGSPKGGRGCERKRMCHTPKGRAPRRGRANTNKLARENLRKERASRDMTGFGGTRNFSTIGRSPHMRCTILQKTRSQRKMN